MPLNSLRQPRARRIAEVTLAGAVALSAVVAGPGLFRDHPTASVDAAASMAPTTDSSTTTVVAVPTLATPGDPSLNMSPSDASRHRARLATDPAYQVRWAYLQASPLERLALASYLNPPPPAPAPAPEATTAPAPQQAPAATRAVANGSVWDRLSTCEAHNNWATHTAPGFSGGLQFADGTWRSYGGTAYAPKAWQASREQQIAVAEKVLASAGWKAWPACSRKLGLR